MSIIQLPAEPVNPSPVRSSEFPAVREDLTLADLIGKRPASGFQFIAPPGAPGATHVWCNHCWIEIEPKLDGAHPGPPLFIVRFEPYTFSREDWHSTTAEIRKRLLAAGARFYHSEKSWRIPVTESNRDALFAILSDYAFHLDAPTHAALRNRETVEVAA